MWVIVLALTYLKITFAFASVGILLLSAVIVPANRRSCITALCGALLTLLILTIISPVNRAYWADLQRAAAAAPIDTSSIDPFRLFKLKSDIMAGWIYFFLPVTFAVWLGRTSRDQAERRNGDRILLATLITSGANFGLAWQNYDSAMPAQIVALAITFSGFRQRTLARNSNLYAGHTPPFLSPSTIHDRDRIPVTLAAICLVVMMGAGILRDAIAIIKHTETSVFGVTQPISTLSPALQGLHVPRDNHPSIIGDILNGRIGPDLYTSRSSVTWHNDLPAIIDDGWRLFQAHRPTNPHVATLGFSPIMSYITQTTPPKHVPAWIDQDRTIGLRAPIIPETTFDDTNVIMILKLHDHEIPLNMVKAYLMVNFKIAGETPIWQMWVRTTALAPSTGSSVGN